MEELKQKYKNLPLWARLGLMGFLGFLPGLYYYLDQGQALEDQFVEVQSQEQVARVTFEKARQRKASLPKLEEQLAFTEDQLGRAQKLLPDRIVIEEILEEAAHIAKETDVTLVRFKPSEEVAHTTDGYQYAELPIETEIVGTYQAIASFFDKIAHLETTIFVRDIGITPLSGANQQMAPQSARATARPQGAPGLSQQNGAADSRGQGVLDQSEEGSQSGGLGATATTAQLLGMSAQAAEENVVESAKFRLIVYRGIGQVEVKPEVPGAAGSTPANSPNPSDPTATPEQKT